MLVAPLCPDAAHNFTPQSRKILREIGAPLSKIHLPGFETRAFVYFEEGDMKKYVVEDRRGYRRFQCVEVNSVVPVCCFEAIFIDRPPDAYLMTAMRDFVKTECIGSLSEHARRSSS